MKLPSLEEIGLQLFFISLAVLANGLYVAAEFSLTRCRKSRVEGLALNGSFAHKLLLIAVKKLNDYISAAQVGITIASLVLGACAEPFFSFLFIPFFQTIHLPEFLLHPFSFGLAMIFATYIHVVVGEFIPKTLALQHPEEVAIFTILPLHWSYRITKPLVWVLNKSANVFLRLGGLSISDQVILAYSEDEIKLLLKESQKEGVIERAEEEMVNKVFEFTDTVVREVMTPRIDIVGVDHNASVEEAAQLVIEHRVSKLPVYEKNIDTIRGLIYTADIFDYIYQNKNSLSISKLSREIKRVPESKPIASLLTEFRKERVQVALVLDEFGGTSGLVTLRDIVEELVGNIYDEDEKEEELIVQISDCEYLIDSRVSIDEVNEFLEEDFSDEHFDTIGGFVFGLIGKQPQVGDEVLFGSWAFTVEKSERQIEQIKAQKVQELPIPKEYIETDES